MATPAATLEPARRTEEPPAPAVSTEEPDATYMTPNSVLAYSLAPYATQPAAGGEETVPPPDLEQGGVGPSQPEQGEPQQSLPEQGELQQSLPEQGEPQQSLPEQSSTEQTGPAPLDAEPLDLDRADAPPDGGSAPAQPAQAPGSPTAAPPPPPPAPPAAPPTQTPPAQPGAPSKGAPGGASRGGGSGRGGGGGSAAAQPGAGAAGSGDSAAATGADQAGGAADPLAAWKAAIGKRTDEISAPPLDGVAAAPGQLSSQAQATEQQRAGERPDYAVDAKAVLPAAPQGPPPEEQLDTTAADAAIAAVDAAGRVKLSDQTFPAMTPIPAGMRAPPKPPPAVPSAPAADGPAAKVAPDGKPVDPKAKAVAGKVAAVVPGPVAKAGDKVVVSDPGTRAELAPLPAAQATLIGDVAARVLRDAPAHARNIVDGASATLGARGSVAELTTLANSLLPAELAAITTELEGIAAAAGVSAGALQAKVTEQKKALEKQAAEGGAQLDRQTTAATGAVAERRGEEQQEIAGAGKAVRDEVDRKQAAAKGVADPTVINARRDTYLDTEVTTVAAGVARLRSAQERREADLRRVGDDQKTEYRRQARAEAAEIKAANADETQGKIAARPVLDWGERQALEVDAVVQRLTREAGAEVKRHDADVRAAGETAREQIRDWAAERLGRERSWWDRLVDAFDDWTSQSKADTKAWERQRDAESRDKIAADLTKLADLQTLLGKRNQAATTDALLRMSKEEQAVALAFLTGKEDALGAVASGLVARISSRRVPELGKQLEDKAIADLGWVTLDKIGKAQTPGFSAGEIIVDIRASVKGIGTDEKRLFEALEGRTRIQVAALRGAYKGRLHRDMDDDINSDVVGSEQDRVDALLSGDPTKAAVATLRDAVSGAGTDEATIMRTLRGKTPAERDAIIAAYEETYHVTLRADLVADMEGNELGQADALLAGDTDKADAMALREAMQGDGTDEDAITGVYAQIRTEVEATAHAKGMTTAEVDAEIKRRNAAVTLAYGTAFAHGNVTALEADFRTELSYGELNLALAQKSGDQTAIDVAKLEIEHQGVYTADEKVNDVLKAQEARAKKEVMRDLLVAFDAKAATMTPEERKAAMEKLEAEAETEATKRAKVLMGNLTTGYDAAVGHGAFDRLLTDELSDNWLTGYAGTEARERVASGGKLSDAKELKFAILGVGTNKKAIRDALKGKSKEEIAKIKQDYAAATGGNDLLADLHGDLGGRDEADMTILLETGDSTPEERRENFRRRREWELTEGVGEDGKAAVAEEERILSETSADVEAAYAEYQKLKATPGADPAKTQAALEDFERLMGYGDKDIERHREQLDSETDTAAMIGATVVGLAVSIATLGTATPVVAAIVGAVAATATTMSIKIGMKGGAYSGEDAAIDLAQGTADALLAIATAGWGEAIVKVLARNMPAVAALTHAAETGLLARITTKGLESAIEGGITGFPSGAWGAILDEGTWRSSDPLGVILKAGGAAAGQGAAMGAVTGAGMDAAFGGPLTPGAHPTATDAGLRTTPEAKITQAAAPEATVTPTTEVDVTPSATPKGDATTPKADVTPTATPEADVASTATPDVDSIPTPTSDPGVTSTQTPDPKADPHAPVRDATGEQRSAGESTTNPEVVTDEALNTTRTPGDGAQIDTLDATEAVGGVSGDVHPTSEWQLAEKKVKKLMDEKVVGPTNPKDEYWAVPGTMVESAKLDPAAAPGTSPPGALDYVMKVPATDGRTAITVVVDVTVQIKESTQLSPAHVSPDGTSTAGKGRVKLVAPTPPDTRWKGVIEIDSHLSSDAFKYVAGHEVDEIARIVKKYPQGASQAEIAAQMKEGIFTTTPESTSAAGDPSIATAHDHAAAVELAELHDRKAKATKPEELRTLADSIEKLKKQMGLDRPENLGAKLALLAEHGPIGRSPNVQDSWDALIKSLHDLGASTTVAGVEALRGGPLARDTPLGGGLVNTSHLVAPEAHGANVKKDPAIQTFIDSGIFGGHDDATLKAWVANGELGYGLRKVGEIEPGGFKAHKYEQYFWTGPPPTPPLPAVGPLEPQWVKAAGPKTTVSDMPAFLAAVDLELKAKYRGTLPVQAHDFVTLPGGLKVDFWIQQGRVMTCYPEARQF